MVESSRLVFRLLCVKLKSLNFDFIIINIVKFSNFIEVVSLTPVMLKYVLLGEFN